MISLLGKPISLNSLYTLSLFVCLVVFSILIARRKFRLATKYSSLELKKYKKALELMNTNTAMSVALGIKNDKTSRKVAQLRKFIFFDYNERHMKEVSNQLRILNKKDEEGLPVTSDDIYIKSCIYSGIYITVIVIASLFNLIFLLGLLFKKVVENIPYAMLNGEVKKLIKDIDVQMPQFISLFYYKFRKQESVFDLQPLLDDFSPMANESMIRLLNLLKTSIKDMGDEQALGYITVLYGESSYVRQFTSCAMALCKYQDNAIVQLNNLYEELKKMRIRRFNNERIRRESIRNRVYQLVIIPIMINSLLLILGMIS